MSRTPTPQQQKSVIALAVEKVIKVGACAGSGKTSTLVMMAESQPVPSLYLAFNKVTANEAAEKFPKHVTSKTTHSVAYAAFGVKITEKLSRPKGRYVNVAGTGTEIARYYKIDQIEFDEGKMVSAPFIGLLVKGAVARFEQSADSSLQMKHVPTGELMDKLGLDTQVNFVKQKVLAYAKNLWKERTDVRSPVLATHDTYLKMFQLSKPVFNGYEIVYVDEFQDTTPCVLDIIKNQMENGIKVVMVGDARQAIYGWRGAVNAMLSVDCPEFPLTKSFRYGQAIADIATAVLEGAMKIEGNENIESKAGLSDLIDESQPYTRLFRTNSALLYAAISEIRRGTEVSIEIDVKDFVKLLQSALALYRGDMKQVKHDKIIPYNEWDELIGEVKHDAELKRLAKVVQEGLAEHWIDTLESHVNSRSPHITFTTAHKSKGREFKQVRIEGDFKECYNEDGEWVGLTTEEQNLLYVAVTRAINVLEYNVTVQQFLNHEKSEAVEGMAEDVIGRMIRGVGFDYGMSLQGEQAQYAAMEQEGPRWA
jgi:superfamily I DNA/RNA helicase